MPRCKVLKGHQAFVRALTIVKQLLRQLHSLDKRNGLARRLARPHCLCHLKHRLRRYQACVLCPNAHHHHFTTPRSWQLWFALSNLSQSAMGLERQQGRGTIIKVVESEFGRKNGVLPHQVEVGWRLLFVANAIFDRRPHVAGNPVPLEVVVQGQRARVCCVGAAQIFTFKSARSYLPLLAHLKRETVHHRVMSLPCRRILSTADSATQLRSESQKNMSQ